MRFKIHIFKRIRIRTKVMKVGRIGTLIIFKNSANHELTDPERLMFVGILKYSVNKNFNKE